MIQLVVFDLDGTLVDSSQDLAAATNALLSELGAGTLPPEVIVGFVGEGAAVLVRRALERSGFDPDTPRALDRFLAHYDARLLDSTKPYPRTVETVGLLRARYRLAVLTNKPERPTLQILRLEWTAFTDVIGGDLCGRKPDPAGLLDLVARAGITPAKTLLVGDSPVDPPPHGAPARTSAWRGMDSVTGSTRTGFGGRVVHRRTSRAAGDHRRIR
jgi:phosphoglycolate phosphatase